MSNKPPKIVIPGMNRGAGIPGGYILGRRRGSKQGPVELLNLAQVGGMGIATAAQVTDSTSQVQSIAHSETVSLSRGVSTSLSGAISSTSSLSTAISTVISGSISTVTSMVNSLSTAGGGGGGGGGGSVSLVQSLALVGNTVLNSITLGANPTAGNQLIVLGTHWTTALTVAQGWNTIINTAGATTDGEIALWKLVSATDAASATIAPFTGGAAGQMGVAFEVSGALPFTGALDHFKETTATVKTLTGVSIKANSLMIGFFATLSANTAPSSVTNVTSLTTVTGTTTNGSPRQVTGFYLSAMAAGSVTTTATYAGSASQYGQAYVLTAA